MDAMLDPLRWKRLSPREREEEKENLQTIGGIFGREVMGAFANRGSR
jgi:hypothetical protein